MIRKSQMSFFNKPVHPEPSKSEMDLKREEAYKASDYKDSMELMERRFSKL